MRAARPRRPAVRHATSHDASRDGDSKREDMTMISRELISKVLVALLAFALGSTTIVLAGAVNGVVYACVHSSSGTIHIIAATQTCATNEQLIASNEKAVQRLTGAPGPAGTGRPGSATGRGGPTG